MLGYLLWLNGVIKLSFFGELNICFDSSIFVSVSVLIEILFCVLDWLNGLWLFYASVFEGRISLNDSSDYNWLYKYWLKS